MKKNILFFTVTALLFNCTLQSIPVGGGPVVDRETFSNQMPPEIIPGKTGSIRHLPHVPYSSGDNITEMSPMQESSDEHSQLMYKLDLVDKKLDRLTTMFARQFHTRVPVIKTVGK